MKDEGKNAWMTAKADSEWKTNEKLREFVDKLFPRGRSWFFGDRISVFMRITERYLLGEKANTLDVASVEVDENCRGNGFFTSFLREVEQIAFELNRVVYVESVLEERLREFLVRNSYVMIPGSMPPCFMKDLRREKNE